ncbi:MAG: ATP-binding cassette domain-containing protein [Candidatus Omnitrophica bacterium]|nr:ATP-binding cassette domain-containing protein [Candidatus Omnitrophota bacterium]
MALKPKIQVENIHKSFENKQVLKGASLTVYEGETFLIIGRSGAGKSVLLKNILGLQHPDSGRVLIDDTDISRLNPSESKRIRLKFGLVYQGSALFDFLTIEENVGFYFYQHTKMKRARVREKVRDMLALVGLKDIEDLYPYQLSGGMRKRVAIARAIIYNPEIIVYDEPTTGVDPISVDKIVSLIEGLHSQFNITSLVVTHDLEVGLKIADRLAFLLGGRMIFEGDTQDLEQTEDKRVIQFLEGSSKGPIQEMEV